MLSLFLSFLYCPPPFRGKKRGRWKFQFLMFFSVVYFCAAPKVGDHFLDMYRYSLMRAIKVQFTDRRLDTGQPGARELARWVKLDTVLMGVNLDEKSLDDPELEPMTDEEVAKLSKSSKNLKRTISFNCGGKQLSCGCGSGAPRKHRRKQSQEHDDHDEVVQPKETVSSPKELSPEAESLPV